MNTGAAASEPPPKLYTMGDVAETLQMSVAWVKKRVAAGDIEYVKLGRSVRFTDAQVATLIRAKTVVPITAAPRTRRRGNL